MSKVVRNLPDGGLAAPIARWRRAFGVAGILLLATAVALLSGSALVSAGAADTAHLLGTVSSGGTALPGIETVAYRLADDGSWDLAGFATTDGLGQYDIGALAAGTYHLRFIDSTGAHLGEYLDDAATNGAAQDVAVADGASVAVAGADLAPAAHLTGSVTADGGPLAGIGVAAYRFLSDPAFHDYWAPVATARTDAAGRYDLAGLSSGTYRVGYTDHSDAFLDEYWGDAATVELSSDVPVAAGATVTDLDTVLTAVSHIQGTVTDPDGPVAGVAVEALELVDGAWRLAAQATTDGAGSYDLAGLHPGAYRVGFDDWGASRAHEFFANAPRLAGAEDVLVTPSTTVTGIDALLASGHIRGSITDAGGGGVDGLALAYTRDGADWEVAGAGTTDADGTYDIAGLSAGTYRVQLSDFGTEDAAALTEWWRNRASLAAADDVVLAEGGSRAGIDGTLVPGEHAPLPTVTNTGLPAVSGQPQVGSPLTASTGSWDPATGLTHTFSWFADGAPIVGATASTYTPTADVVGRRLTVRVTASAIGRTPGSAVSPPTAPVLASPASPAPGTGSAPKPPAKVVSWVLPRIIGKARVGQRLRVSSGVWTPSVVFRKLHWLADGRAIRKATGATFVVTRRQAGTRLTVRVVALSPGYEPLTVRTRPTARVKP